MFKKYSLFILATLILSTFSSCGFIKMDFSVAADQFNDFAPEESLETSHEVSEEPLGISYEVSEDCGCYGPEFTGGCTYISAPVCGCDGITYSNACLALKNGIYIYRRGECGKPYPIIRPIILPTNPPEIHPSPASPPIVNPQPTNYPEVKPWPANPRKPANNKLPQRGGATLVQTKEPGRK